MAAVVWLVLDVIERRAVRAAADPVAAADRRSRAPPDGGVLLRGRLATASLLWGYERLLRRVVADTNLDLLHFRCTRWAASGLAVEFALVLLHAAVIWGAAATIRLAGAHCCARRARWSWRLTAAGALARGGGRRVRVRAGHPRRRCQIGPMWIALVVAGLCALALARVNGRMRRDLADRPARRVLPRTADAGGRDVSVAARPRDRSQGAT